MPRPTLSSSSVARRPRERRGDRPGAPGPPPREVPQVAAVGPARPGGPSPWLVIREVLDRTQADGLSTLQQAGAVYTALVHHGLMDGGRA